jgi:hypothetical protein
MALIKCYECGKEFSSSSPRCIHCGAIDKSQWWVGFFAVGLVAFLFMAITGLSLALPGWGIGLFMSVSIMVYNCFRPWPYTPKISQLKLSSDWPWISFLKTKKTAKKKTAKKSVLKEWNQNEFDEKYHPKKSAAKKKKTAKKKTVKKSSTKKSV